MKKNIKFYLNILKDKLDFSDFFCYYSYALILANILKFNIKNAGIV